jgi:hypothetical protein
MDNSIEKENHITFFAETNFRNKQVRFGIKRDGAICNIDAETGTGKAKLCIGGAKQPPPRGPNDTPVTSSGEERDPYDRLLIWLIQARDGANQEAKADKDKPDPGPAVVTQLTTDTKIAIAQSAEFMKSVIKK